MHILVVGDKDWERKLLREAVTALGHTCDEAEDGDVGFVRYQALNPDVILSDFIMPGLNGLELCREVRAHPGPNYTHFIVVSTLNERGHVLEGLRSGADDYLPKPIDIESLEARLLTAARVTTLHKRLADQNRELEVLSERLREEGRRDPLTNVGNRLRFREDSRAVLDAHHRYGHDYSFVLGDIDHFKQYNDTYGHLEGDENLKRVALLLDEETRASDNVYRFGGEEFLIVLSEQGVGSAHEAAERLRKAIFAQQIVHEGNPGYGVVTMTFGVAQLFGSTPEALEQTLKHADEALYEGKEGGRNRVVCWPRATY